MKIQKEVLNRVCEHLGLDLDSEPCQQVQNYLKSNPQCKVFVDNIKKTIQIYKVTKGCEELDDDVCRKLLTNLNLNEPKPSDKEK